MESVIKTIEESSKEYFPSLNNTEIIVQDELIKHKSEIHKYTICDSKEKHIIFGKIGETTEQEFLNLNYLWNKYYHKESTYTIPRPYGFFPEHNLLLMEFFNGTSVKKRLTEHLWIGYNNFFSNAFQNYISRSVEWLILFEKINKDTLDSKDIQFFFSNSMEHLDKIKYLDIPTKNRITDIVTTIASNFDYIPIKFSQPGFTPHHIFLAKNKVYVIDWVRGVMPMEMIFIEVHNFIRRLDSLSRFRFFSRNRINSLKELFLSEYKSKTCYKEFLSYYKITKIFVTLNVMAKLAKKDGQASRLSLIFLNDLLKQIESN